MSELKQILDNYKVASGIANQEINEDPRGYQVRLGKVNRAKSDLKELTNKYRDVIRSSSSFILVSGDNAEAFSKMASKDFGCFVVDGEAVPRIVASQMHKDIYTGKSLTSSSFDTANGFLTDVLDDIGVVSYPYMLFNKTYSKILNDEDDLRNLLKIAIGEKIGYEIAGVFATNHIVEDALKQGFSGKTFPIILTTTDEEYMRNLREGLLSTTKNVFVVSTSEGSLEDIAISKLDKMTKKSVESTLKEIKKRIV